MSKPELIKAITKVIEDTAFKSRRFYNRKFPTPEEFAKDIVEFLYGVAKKEADEEAKSKEEVRPAVQETPDGVRGTVEDGS